MMIPEEVRKEHMAICKNCKEREAVRRMVDFHVDWLDCFWDCPNDYEHWIAGQTERGESDETVNCQKANKQDA